MNRLQRNVFYINVGLPHVHAILNSVLPTNCKRLQKSYLFICLFVYWFLFFDLPLFLKVTSTFSSFN